jgi:hypothetical protein
VLVKFPQLDLSHLENELHGFFLVWPQIVLRTGVLSLIDGLMNV